MVKYVFKNKQQPLSVAEIQAWQQLTAAQPMQASEHLDAEANSATVVGDGPGEEVAMHQGADAGRAAPEAGPGGHRGPGA